MRCGIGQFVGSWVSASGHRLEIKKVHQTQALVDLLDPSGNPVRLPYKNSAPSVHMAAHYDDCTGFVAVELWEEGKGFILELTHEYNYELDERSREALVPAIGRYERDGFLDEFYPLFGPLAPFVRRKRQNETVQRTGGTGAGRFAPSEIRRSSSAGFRR